MLSYLKEKTLGVASQVAGAAISAAGAQPNAGHTQVSMLAHTYE